MPCDHWWTSWRGKNRWEMRIQLSIHWIEWIVFDEAYSHLDNGKCLEADEVLTFVLFLLFSFLFFCLNETNVHLIVFFSFGNKLITKDYFFSHVLNYQMFNGYPLDNVIRLVEFVVCVCLMIKQQQQTIVLNCNQKRISHRWSCRKNFLMKSIVIIFIIRSS